MNANGTRCPHCGSREFWPSRRRALERILGRGLPYRPFRCRACLRRYLQPKPWLKPALALLVLLLVAGGGAFLALGPLGVGQSDDRPAEADRPLAAAPDPAPEQLAAPPGADPDKPMPKPAPEPEPAPPAPEEPAAEAAPSPEDPDAGRVRLFRLHLNVVPEDTG
ncbi:hypothetical protein [Desulfohalovibrio reitneri]|jgi:hypothetical protein|uniref:hypothetical protein n=1 Tax=Desulfohalovibrio reitneri TaxID=1307759 RepID=UPI000554BA31|nr:hypothetical protein [Desulfohalovibrio reitneri]